MGISTHVLDTAAGRPAEGVFVTLERQTPNGDWSRVGAAATDVDGRVEGLLEGRAAAADLEGGRFRLEFETGAYFLARGITPFFPRVRLEFEIREASEHYHVPLLLSPFAYTTYRGS